MNFNSFNQAMQIAKWWSPRVKNLWTTTVASTMVSLWQLRNNIFFDNKQLDINKCRYYITHQIWTISHLSLATSFNDARDIHVTSAWNVSLRPSPAPNIKQGVWIPPDPQIIKLNTNGAARGNPGLAAIGVCFRDHSSIFKLSLWRSIGINTNYITECLAILEGTELAIVKNWLHL
ncbi:hypothetical protein IFM89_038280 [Coptis chinensis]|uniref:RNase H type-1 domain-containing protein n=1 Tax=Coptis chinensis TaxID=261450 RepID=A0A835M2Z1_9MAGN|nr:hypothetical protein IFM89_038280 [Coptis chinensis]